MGGQAKNISREYKKKKTGATLKPTNWLTVEDALDVGFPGAVTVE